MARKNNTKHRSRANAPEFAKRLASLIEKCFDGTRRGLATTLKMDPAAVHRLCTTGAGSEDNICIILGHLHLKRRRIVEILAARRAELSTGKAREIWEDFCYAFPNSHEYMTELCPFPLDRVCACSYAGISIQYILDLARATNVEHVDDLAKLKTHQAIRLYDALAQEYGSEKAKIVFSPETDRRIPFLAHLDTFQEYDAGDYTELTNCDGKSLFGIPHVVLTRYTFGAGGEVGTHRHAGGVEFLYSEKGSFELEYKGIRYPRLLADDGSVIVLDGRKSHSIKLAKGKSGRLLVVRYDPRRRSLRPGPTLRERARRHDAKQQRKADGR